MGWFFNRQGRDSGRKQSGGEAAKNKQRFRRKKSPQPGQRSAVGHFERLEAREVFSVTFHGGALLTNVEAQGVYLGGDWSTNSTLNSQAASLDQYVNYVVKSPYMDTMTSAGYNVGEGTATPGVILNQTLDKTNGVSDSQVRSYLQSAISSAQLAAPDANRLYVVYVEPNVVIKNGTATSQNSFLGYHGAFAGKDAAGRAVDIHYAIMAYPGGPNPTNTSQGFATSFDQLTAVSSHEIAEAVTDPNVNYKTLGWYDDQLNGEIGDLTSATTRLNNYLVQEVVNKNDQPMTIVSGTGGTTGGTTGTTTLAAPQNVTATALSSTSAQLTWSSVSGTSGYHIYQLVNSQWTLIGTMASTATSATVTGLTAGSTNSFKVQAYNSTTTADSATVTVALPAGTTLAAPQNVKVTATSSTSAQITWNTVSGASGYRVIQVIGSQRYTLGSFGPTVTSANITGLTAGSTNSFVVEAYSTTTYADSVLVSVTLPAPQTLAAPTVTAKATSSTTAALSWSPVSGASGYRIYMWNGYQAVLLGTFNSTTSSVTITNLTPGSTSYFLVESFNSSSAADSPWLTVTTPYV